jgi:hypothetical protein
MTETETKPDAPESTALAEVQKPSVSPAISTAFGMLPRNMNEGMKLSTMLAKSTLVPKEFMDNPANIYLALQWGAELGLPPMQSLQSIAVINGRPTMWGDAVLALVWASGKLETIEEVIDKTDPANAVAKCIVKRKGQPIRTTTFSWQDAQRANLTEKASPWKTYPTRMLQMRARGFALRDVFPDVLRGVITSEEAIDLPPEAVQGQETRPTDQLDIYFFGLEPDVQEKLHGLVKASGLSKGQITSLIKKHPGNIPGFQAALVAAAEKVQGKALPPASASSATPSPAPDQVKATKAAPAPAKAAAPDVHDVFKGPPAAAPLPEDDESF